MRAKIIESCARTLWCMTWADWAEENDCLPAGCDLNEVAPATPEYATSVATKLVCEVEKRSGCDIETLYERLASADGKHYREPSPERLGDCIAYQSAGAGVTWHDDHPTDIRSLIPYIEFHWMGGDEFWCEL